MRIAVSQSNYVPWLGYFSLMTKCDLFIVHDGLAFSKGSFRNRNRVGIDKLHWITVPVKKFVLGTPISQIEVTPSQWADLHIRRIEHLLGNLPFYESESKFFTSKLRSLQPLGSISKINIALIRSVIDYLDLQVQILTLDQDYDQQEKNLRLVNLVRDYNGSCYVSSIQANRYLRPSIFESFGINLIIENYRDYIYALESQSRLDVSVIQTLMHLGRENVKEILTQSSAGVQVYLDRLSDSDVSTLFKMQSNEHWAWLRGTKNLPKDIEETRHWLFNPNESRIWLRGVREAKSGNCLGYVTLERLTVESSDQLFVGIFIPSSEGNGVSRQALELVKIWAFNEFNAKLLLAKIRDSNIRSQHLFHKCGFTLIERVGEFDIYKLDSWSVVSEN